MCGSAEARVLGRRLNGHQGLRPRRFIGVATTVAQCRTCGLIYANPRPVPEAVANHYDRLPEEYWQAGYFEDQADYCASQAHRFSALWDGNDIPRALDIGAGVGKAMAALERLGFDTFGIEPSAAFRGRAIANGVDPDRLQLAAVEDAQYEPGTFDFVSFASVLEHLHDPAAALTRALEWLAPGGLIHVEVPSAKWLLGRLLNLAHRGRGVDNVTNLSPMHPPYHLYEFTPCSFERHAQRASYEVVDHRFYPCHMFLPPLADALASRLMAATDTGMQLEVWLRHARCSQ
jgi:SAM-dependent methyltransferase